MPLPVQSFADLLAEITADLSAIPASDPTIAVGVLPVIKTVLAKLAAAELAYLGQLPYSALLWSYLTGGYLDREAAGFGLVREPATISAGTVQFTGSVGVPIPAGTRMQDSTMAITLATAAAATVGSGGTVVVPVVSVTSGSAANLASGAPVTLLVALAGVDAMGLVQSPGLTGGTDAESDAAFHVRFSTRLSAPPQGGADTDYVAWAKLVPGVTRAWPYPTWGGAGSVGLAFAMDGRANPVPLSADVAAVQAQVVALAPVVGSFTAFAPTVLSVAVTIANLAPATGFTLAQAQAGATAAVAALNYQTVPGAKYYLASLATAIGNGAGVGTFDLSAPVADMVPSTYQMVQFVAPVFT